MSWASSCPSSVASLWAPLARPWLLPLSLVAVGLVMGTTTLAGQSRLPLLLLRREVTISGAAEDLGPVATIRVSSRGVIAVWQTQDFQLRFFDSSGVALGRFGRRGEGPGEFRALGMRAGWIGDTMWVIDPATRRYTMIDERFRLVRSVPWPTALYLSSSDSISLLSSAGLVPIAILPGQTFISTVRVRPNQPRPRWMPEGESRLPMVAATRAGLFQRVILWEPPDVGAACLIPVTTNEGQWNTRIPYCPQTIMELSPNGRFAVSAVPQTTGVVRFTTLDTSGDTVLSKLQSYESRQIPNEVVDSAVRSLKQLRGISPNATSAFRQQALNAVEAALRKTSVPSNYPPFVRLVVGNDGSFWLEEFPDGEGRKWVGYSADGRTIGRVELAKKAILQVASSTHLWVLESDLDDVQSVVRYRVVRR